jgi:hypothetical protein
MHRYISSLVLGLTSTVSAASLSISVGEDSALSFEPDTLTAAVGDT